jgi:hypothetical protein
MAKSLRELYEESLSGKFTRVYDVFGVSTTQETVTLAGQTHIPAPVEGNGPFKKFDDGLIRGGLYNAITATALDEVRLGKFLLSTNGALSLVKQSGLQFSNPNTSYTIATTSSKVVDTQLFDYVGPLAAAGGNAFGLHFDRHGLKPTFNNDPLSVPGSYLNSNKVGNKFISRLELYKDKINEFTGNGNLTLYEYKGGPDSYLGLGTTKAAVGLNSLNRNDFSTNKSKTDTSTNGFIPWSYKDIQTYSSNETKQYVSSSLGKIFEENSFNTVNISKFPRDFREETNSPGWDNYITKNIHRRVGVTSNNSNIGSPNTIDSINMLTITPRSTFYNNSNSAKEAGIKDINQIYTGLFDETKVAEKISGNYARDIIKFRIEFLNNDQPVWPLKTTGEGINKVLPTQNTDVLAFRAYLADISDNFSSTWKEFNYMGRGEPFYTYEGFKRDINFSFYLYAHSAAEMPAIYTKLNYLMSNMAPDYTSKGQMRGNYAYLTIGDYIYQQPGVFTSLNVSDLLTAPWEIAINEPELRTTNLGDASQHEVPKYMKISMAFKPIHSFLPKKNKRDKDHTATFITPDFRQGFPNRYLPQTRLRISTDENGVSVNGKNTTIQINTTPAQ